MVNGAPALRKPPTSDEVDAVRAELRRISASPQFASAGKLFRFLEFIVEETLEHPNTPVKEYLIGVAVYGRPAHYDPRTDSIVRVEAGKLRTRLVQYYDHLDRSDAVRVSVPKGGYIPSFDFPGSRAADSVLKRGRSHKRLVFWGSLITIALVLSAWQIHGLAARAGSSYSRLEHFSHGGRLAADPAPSRDGHSVAYVTDEPGSPWRNIWIRDLATGDERRLTKHAANDSTPTFSADGRFIAFRSEERGGGIYLIAATGGEPALLVPRGREPRFSPKGLWLSYWVAGDEETREFGRAFLLDVAGHRGPYPKADPLFGAFAHVRSPVWSDDGQRLIALGTLQSDVPEKEYDLWTIRVDNGHPTGLPVKSGIVPLMKTHGVFESTAERSRIRAGAWSEGFVYLTVPNSEQSSLVRVALSARTGVARGEVEDVFPGTEQLSAPFVVKSRALIFASSRVRYGFWSVPTETGVASKVASPEGAVLGVSVSRDGSVVAWHSMIAGGVQSIRAVDVANGKERELARGAVDRPVVSSDGRRVAWRVMENTKQAIDAAFLAEPSKVERLCHNCGRPMSWTADGTRILFETGDPNTGIDALDVFEHKRSPVLSHPSYSLYGPRFLARRGVPSDGWLLFYAATGAGTRQIFVTALRGFRVAPDARWIPVTDGRGSDVEPCWAEAGDAIYFVSRRGSAGGIWVQRVDPKTKQPVGNPVAVYEPLSASRTLLSTLSNRGSTGLTAARGRLFFAMDDTEGSIWFFKPGRN